MQSNRTVCTHSRAHSLSQALLSGLLMFTILAPPNHPCYHWTEGICIFHILFNMWFMPRVNIIQRVRLTDCEGRGLSVCYISDYTCQCCTMMVFDLTSVKVSSWLLTSCKRKTLPNAVQQKQQFVSVLHFILRQTAWFLFLTSAIW